MATAPYEPDESVGAAYVKRVALSSIASEVAARGEQAAARLAREGGEDDRYRATTLRECANVLRDVCGLPRFEFSPLAGASVDP